MVQEWKRCGRGDDTCELGDLMLEGRGGGGGRNSPL